MAPASRLYYDDPALTRFTATVTDIREYSRVNGQSLWQIALDRTAFYPTSGGQPHDIGTLVAKAKSGAALAAEIEEVVEDEDGEVWHMTTKPVLAGTQVEARIDAARRLDHRQQHSGQHLLSALFHAHSGAPTVSFHLGARLSTIDLAADSPEVQSGIIGQFEAIEHLANQHIAENTAVAIRTVSGDEAQALLAEGKLRKLPLRSGPMRLIEIPGLDLNACGGTHVEALGEIGGLLIRGHERLKQSLRIEFVCGLRAVAASRADYAALSDVAASLSVPRADAAAAIRRLQAEAKALAKERQKLREDLASNHAVRLAVEENIQGGLRLVSRTFTEHDGEYVRLLASRLIASVPHTAAVMLSVMEEPATLVLASNHTLPRGCGDILKAALAEQGLKGGGSPTLAHAKLPRMQAEQVAEALRQQVAGELRRTD